MKYSLLILIVVLIVQTNCWDYNNSGSDWVDGICATGQMQSPIDIGLAEAICQNELKINIEYANTNISNLQFNYPSGSNGHKSINANVNWSTITIKDLSSSHEWVYVANKILIRNPSEHTIKNQNFDAELQIHHTLQGDPDTSQRAKDMMINENLVLSFVFEENTNMDFIALQNQNPNTIFHQEFLDLSIITSNPYKTINPQTIMNGKFNYPEKQYFYFQGSSTEPNCEENVTWMVWVEPLYILSDQLQIIKNYFVDNPNFAGGNGNNRLTQSRNERPVWVGGYKCFTSYPQQPYTEPGTKYELQDYSQILSFLNVQIISFIILSLTVILKN